MIDNMNLANISLGKSYEISGFQDGAPAYAEKLYKMGFTEGTRVTLAPVQMSDPMVIQIRGSRIALRKREAKQVLVKELKNA